MKRSGDRVIARDRVIRESDHRVIGRSDHRGSDDNSTVYYLERGGVRLNESRLEPESCGTARRAASKNTCGAAAALGCVFHPRKSSQKETILRLSGTGTLACAEASFLTKQAPAGVPAPHEFGHSAFNVPNKWLVQDYTKRIHRSARAWFRNVMHVLIAALREIFDESAYDRFLQRTKAARSVESYREFLREREAGMLRKPRCC